MTIKILLKPRGKNLQTVILEDVRSVVNDGEFYRFEPYGATPATVFACENVVNWHYVKSRAATVEEGGANDGED
mgnify:CR=1 FL=1